MIQCHELIVHLSHHLQLNALSIAIVSVPKAKPLLTRVEKMSQKSKPAKRPRDEVADTPSRDRSATDQSARPSTQHRPRPHINPQVFTSRDMPRLQEENRETKYRDKACSYCSTRNYQIKHHHFSTARQRSFAIGWVSGEYMCPVCQKLEPPVQPDSVTKRVILSDSTLYGVWDQPSLPSITDHMDIECIVGGRVRHLTRALEMNLLYNKHRLEIVVICGINNIGDGQKADSIAEEYEHLKRVVAEHSKQNQHRPASSVSISTLMLPPKYCSFKVPENAPDLSEWKPAPDFQDRYDEIRKLNITIKELNQQDGLSWLNLHLQGIKMLKSGPQHKYDTRQGAVQVWRERQVFKKIHFTMANKLKLMKYLQNTFKSNANK